MRTGMGSMLRELCRWEVDSFVELSWSSKYRHYYHLHPNMKVGNTDHMTQCNSSHRLAACQTDELKVFRSTQIMKEIFSTDSRVVTRMSLMLLVNS
jgi:hypothetical protein